MIVPVILSGGAGTRLWPLSREDRPKQLLALTGERTMLQATALRVAEWPGAGPPLVVASARHAEEIGRQLDEIGCSQASLILEPLGRNTAPAIALAALTCGKDDLLLVMPSDHLIADPAALRSAVEAAAEQARDNWLVTFGIHPTAPETGYGYLARGAELAGGVYRVAEFAEKPDVATAAAYAASGRHYWNAGIFLFRAAAMLTALRCHAPDVLRHSAAALQAGTCEGGRIRPDASAFARSPSISIDYAVMEKADRVAMVPVAMGWSDLGSWDALDALLAKDGLGNACVGESVAIDTRRCSIWSDGPVVAALGLEDLIIVATAEAVLVMPKGRSQDIRQVVEAVKSGGNRPVK